MLKCAVDKKIYTQFYASFKPGFSHLYKVGARDLGKLSFEPSKLGKLDLKELDRHFKLSDLKP